MNKLKYRCLVLDHDNTVVATTPDIQYPAFMNALIRLGIKLDLNEAEFIRKEYYGLTAYAKEALLLDDNAIKLLTTYFYEYVKTHPSRVYGGIAEILHRYIAAGGLICVVSKSPEEYILRDYQANSLPQPNIVFGLELDAEQHKPNTYPLEQIMRKMNLQASELLVVDDKSSGLEMANAFGADAVISGWGLVDADIKSKMQEKSGRAIYIDTIEDFYYYLFGEKL